MMRFLVVLALAACGGGKGRDLVMTQANNYAYSNTIDIASVDVQAGSDLTFDWSGLTTDVRERPQDPSQVQQMSFVKFAYPLEELLPLIATNQIDAQKEADEIYLFDNNISSDDPKTTTAALTTFAITGITFVPEELLLEDPSATWLVSALNKPRGSIDLLMSKAVIPSGTATNTTDVTLGTGDTTLDFTVDLHSAPPIEASAGEKSYSLDWTDVKTDVYGNDFNSVSGDELLIGHYTGSVGDVEANFLQLDSPDVADGIWRASVVQSTSLDDLSAAVDDAGDPFPGFTADGTWLIGVVCTTCSTPVPLLLSVVEVK
jgi:hypothetical protein